MVAPLVETEPLRPGQKCRKTPQRPCAEPTGFRRFIPCLGSWKAGIHVLCAVAGCPPDHTVLNCLLTLGASLTPCTLGLSLVQLIIMWVLGPCQRTSHDQAVLALKTVSNEAFEPRIQLDSSASGTNHVKGCESPLTGEASCIGGLPLLDEGLLLKHADSPTPLSATLLPIAL